MSDMEMRLIFLHTLMESLANIHDIIPGICGQCFEIRRWVSWVRRPLAYCPVLILSLYLTTNCSVHFETDTFTLYDHGGYAQFSTNWIKKKLLQQNGSLFFDKLRLAVLHLSYSPSYNFTNFPMYECWSAMMYMYDFWCQTCNIFIKNRQIFVSNYTVLTIYQLRLLSMLTQKVINQEIQMILKIQMIRIIFFKKWSNSGRYTLKVLFPVISTLMDFEISFLKYQTC